MHVREKPPLRLSLGAETPTGRHYRWAEDEPEAQNVLSDMRHSSTMPGGDESLDCKLFRKPGIDYSDLGRLTTLTVLGAGADVAGQYRLERAPRTSGDEFAITPSAVGWQAHLTDDKSAKMVYVDIDLSGWGGASAARKIALDTSSIDCDDPQTTPDQSGVSWLETSFTGPWVRARRVEAYYDAKGIPLGSIYFSWKRSPNTGTAAPWGWDVFLADNDVLSGSQDTSGTLVGAGPGTGTLTATTATRTFGMIRFFYSSAAGSSSRYPVYWRPAVYGNHGLTKRGTEDATNAKGFYSSDVIPHALRTWAPLLDFTEGGDGTIQPSGFVIPHLVFLEPTTAAEIITQANRPSLYDWAVWGKTFYYHPRGARGRTWRARVNPSQLSETGPQVDRLWESVVVQYSDVDGSTRTVGPPGSGASTETADLKDSDPENPLNELGITRRDMLQMGTGTVGSATEVGRRFLEEQKLLDTSGQATLVGHVQDDRGVTHPAWRVRAGDSISFIDASDKSPRRIVRAEHTYSSRSTQVDLDSPPEGLQALLERLGVVLVPLGL